MHNDTSSLSITIVVLHLSEHTGSHDDAHNANYNRYDRAEKHDKGDGDLHFPETSFLRLFMELIGVSLPSRCRLRVVARRHHRVLAKSDLLLGALVIGRGLYRVVRLGCHYSSRHCWGTVGDT